MAKPKKATKANKTSPNPPLKKSPTPPQTTAALPTAKSNQPQALRTLSSQPPSMVSKADQVRAIWADFLTTFYQPAVDRFESSDNDDEDAFLRSVQDEWARRLSEKGLTEEDWVDITAAEQVTVYSALFNIVAEEKAIAQVEANMSKSSSKSSSPKAASVLPPFPSWPVPNMSLVVPPPAMTASLSSSSTASNSYATINPAAFHYEAEDSEGSSEFAFFEAVSDGAISTPISPSSLSSKNWWTSDSLQTSPSTSPSSKPVMVDFPVAAQHMVEDESVGSFPVLWKPSAATAAHVPKESPSTPLGKITEWFSALNPMHEPPVRASEWGDEAIWENGTRSMNEDITSKVIPKVENAVEPELVDWSAAWKTKNVPSKVDAQIKPQKAPNAKGKKEIPRPSVDDNKNKPKTDTSKAVPIRDRKQSVTTSFGEPLRSQSSLGRIAGAPQPEVKSGSGWKKAETLVSKRPLAGTPRSNSVEPDWAITQPERKFSEPVDWASALKTLQDEENAGWSDNEPQTPIVNARPTTHPSHTLSHLEIPPSILSSSSNNDYIGPVLCDPLEHGLVHNGVASTDLDKMETDFADFKIKTLVQCIEAFHSAAAAQEIRLVMELHEQTISKGEVARRMAEHRLQMAILQRDKENDRKQRVDDERRRRIKEVDRLVNEQKKLAAFAQEQSRSRALRLRQEEDSRAAELMAKEAELRRKEQLLAEQEQELRRREEEVRRQQADERDSERRRLEEIRRQQSDERDSERRRRELEVQQRESRHMEDERRRRLEEHRLEERRHEERRQELLEERRREERRQEERRQEERRQDELRRQDEEKKRLTRIEETDPERRRQIEQDLEIARRLEKEERQVEMHRRQQEIQSKKAAKQQQEREANNATVRPSDRKVWVTSTDVDKSKRQVIPSFTAAAEPSSSRPAPVATPWNIGGIVPAPAKMNRVVDPKAPFVAKVEASTSKPSLENALTLQPPRLAHKSASSTPDNRTIWHPKPETKPEPMSRSARIEKSKSTSVVTRSRTVSDPSPPSPRLGPKTLLADKVKDAPTAAAPVESKDDVKGKKATVTVEDVPEPEEAVGGGLPVDSMALMLSNVEPEPPSLVEREIRDKENPKEKPTHVRWTPPTETATTATTRARANSSAKGRRAF